MNKNSTTINDKVRFLIRTKKSHLIIGLDVIEKINPYKKETFKLKNLSLLEYAKLLIKITYKDVVGYKFNISFYEKYGVEGLILIKKLINFIREFFSEAIIIADTKSSEIYQGVNNLIDKYFKFLDFDYIFISPWFGSDSIKPFCKLKKKGIGVYIHDSNPSSVELQELRLEKGVKVYQYLASLVNKLDKNDNFIFEVGLNFPEALNEVRKIIGKRKIILTSGVVTQGGILSDLKGNFGDKGENLLVAISRAIIYPKKQKNFYQKENLINIEKEIKKATKFYKEEIFKLSKIK